MASSQLSFGSRSAKRSLRAVETCGTVTTLPAADTRFARALRRVASSVSVITALRNGQPFGTLARGFLVASQEPPTLLVSVGEDETAAQAIRDAGVFCVNVLATGDAGVAQRFAQGAGHDLFADARWDSHLTTGAPALRDCLVSLDCRVRKVFDGAGYLVFAGEVVTTEFWDGERSPLIQHDETFIRL